MHSLPAGGALSVSMVTAENIALMNFNMHCTDEKKKYHLTFSKDSRFLPDICSYKLILLIASQLI